MLFAVNGTLMRGLPLNKNMTEAGACYVREATTAAVYRLYSIEDKYPGMIRVNRLGAKIDLELWEINPVSLIKILMHEPRGLTLGKVILEEGSEVLGILVEPYLVEGKNDITQYGGWRSYIAGLLP